jgi:hypothetical protein
MVARFLVGGCVPTRAEGNDTRAGADATAFGIDFVIGLVDDGCCCDAGFFGGIPFTSSLLSSAAAFATAGFGFEFVRVYAGFNNPCAGVPARINFGLPLIRSYPKETPANETSVRNHDVEHDVNCRNTLDGVYSRNQ